MRNIRFWAVALAAVVLASPAAAGGHRASDIVRAFTTAWNTGDSAQMARLWTADGQSAILGRDVVGRAEIARFFAESQTSFKVTSWSQQGDRRRLVVELEGEIAGVKTTEGVLQPPSLSRLTAVLVWGPDLPGGHHPMGRYFIASLK